MKNLNAEYLPPVKLYWQGRRSNPDKGNQYWHQQIEILDLQQESDLNADIAFIGYVCDEGVRRNRGRIGAHEGPRAFRDRLAKLPIHFIDKNVADAGDIACIDEDMEACQEKLANSVFQLHQQKCFPIAIGGGHDMAYGHFKGLWKALNPNPETKIGIINFDAHFDLRPVEGKSNSGTPFNQILEEYGNQGKNVEYFAIGIQQQSNTKELYTIANQEHIQYVINYDCESANHEMSILKEKLQLFIDRCDYLYVTIDMDGFSSAYAPGVSAPSPLGFTPYFVFKLLPFLIQTKKIKGFEIAELNPSMDFDMHTANLAAKIADFFVMNYEK